MATYFDILSQVRDVVLALDVLVDAGVSGAVRKRPFFSREHGDRHPFVCFSGVNESVADLQMDNNAWLDYPVVVAIFLGKNAALQNEDDYQLQLDAREAIRKALWKPNSIPLAAQFDCNYEPDPVFDLQGLSELFDVSLQMFTFRVSEERADS